MRMAASERGAAFMSRRGVWGGEGAGAPTGGCALCAPCRVTAATRTQQ